jgi:hypothetical protein
MANDNVQANQSTTSGAVFRTYADSSGVEHSASVIEFGITISPGANVLQPVTAANPLPITGSVIVTQTTGSNLHVAVDSLPALVAGSALIGSVQLVDSGGVNKAAVSGGGALSVAIVSGGGANPAAGVIGSAVPADGSYNAVNVGGTLEGQSGLHVGSLYVAATDMSSVGGVALALGQTTMANSVPVVISNNQSTLPISGSVTVSGTTTISGTVTANQGGAPWSQNLTEIGGASFALGQQVAAGSLPVVLTAAQLSALEPLSTVAVTQSTSPWVISGTVTANAGSGNFNVVGTVTANAGSGTFGTKDASDGPVSPGTAAGNSLLTGAVYTAAGVTLSNGQQVAAQCDINGHLLVDAVVVSGANAAAAPTGTSVPTDASYNGVDVAGNLLGQTGVSVSGHVAADTNVATVGGSGFALGQQLATASLPVVLTAAQITTLTPLSTVTADQGGAPWSQNITEVGGSSFALGQQLAAASLPVVLTASQLSTLTPLSTITANAGTGTFNTQDAADGPVSPGTAAAKSILIGGQYNSGGVTLANGEQSAAQFDSSGNLKVNVAAGSGQNAAASATGSAPPSDADYTGINVSSTLRGQTGSNPAGVIYAAHQDVVAINGEVLSLGQTTMANSIPVALASNQSAIAVTQSGSWTVTANAGTGTFITSDLADGSVSGGTAGTKSLLAGVIYNSSPITLTNGQQSGVQADANGYLYVHIAAGSTGNSAASATGAAVPADADYGGINVGTTLRGQTGSNPSTGVYATHMDLAAISGTTLTFGQATASASLPVVLASNQLGIPAPPDTTSGPSNLTGTGAVSIATSGQSTVAALVTGSWTGTITFRRSVDGTTWETCNALAAGAIVSSITGNATVYIECAGASIVELLGGSVTGTAVVTLRASSGLNVVSIGNAVAITSGGTLTTSDLADGSISGGTAGSKSIAIGGLYNTSLPTLTNGEQCAAQLDSSARLYVNVSNASLTVAQATGTNLHTVLDSGNLTTVSTVTAVTSITNAVTVQQATGTNLHTVIDSGTVTANIGTTGGVTVAQGSTTSGQSGPLIQAAVTTASPSYTTAQTSPLSLTLAGALRTDASATTQPVSISQATPGTTNAVSLPDQPNTVGTISAADSATTSTTGANGQSIITGTPTTNSSVVATLSGEASVVLTLSGNTGASTYVFEKSGDGTNYVATGGLVIGSSSANPTNTSSVTASKAVMRFEVSGMVNFRVRCTTFVSGTTTATIQPGYGPGLLATAITTATAGVLGGVEVYDASGVNKLSVSSGGAAAVNVTDVGGAALALGQTTMSASVPVALASNQSVLSVQGDAASGASVTGNPLLDGGAATNVEPTAVSTGQAVAQAMTLTGKQIVQPYANPENFIAGGTSTTGSSAVNLIGSITGFRAYVTTLIFANSSATAVVVTVTDGTITLYIPVPATGGAVVTFPTPVRFASATNVTMQSSAAETTVYGSYSGYKGT